MASDPLMGSIFLFAGNFAPRGYLLCQGQSLAISQNSALFAILGTTYGGNGVSTFNLPDLRGRAAVGTGPANPEGQTGGAATVTLTAANVPSHTHTINVSTGSGGQTSAQNHFIATANDPASGAAYPSFDTAATAGATLAPGSVNPNAGGGVPVSVQNPFLALNYIIATQGIFPTRN